MRESIPRVRPVDAGAMRDLAVRRVLREYDRWGSGNPRALGDLDDALGELDAAQRRLDDALNEEAGA